MVRIIQKRNNVPVNTAIKPEIVFPEVEPDKEQNALIVKVRQQSRAAMSAFGQFMRRKVLTRKFGKRALIVLGWTLAVAAALAAVGALCYGIWCLLVWFCEVVLPMLLRFLVSYVISLVIVAIVVANAFRGTNQGALVADFIIAFVIAIFLNSCMFG